MSPTSLMELQNLCRLLKMSNNSLKDPKSKEIEVWITELHQVKLELWTETIGFSSYLWSSFGLVVIVTWFAICDMWNCFGSVMWFVFFQDKLILIFFLWGNHLRLIQISWWSRRVVIHLYQFYYHNTLPATLLTMK